MRRLLTLFAIVSLTSTLRALADDHTGVWKLNLQKSKLHFTVRSYLIKVELTDPMTQRLTFDIVTGDGKKYHQEVFRINDGKEHPSKGVGVPSGVSEIVSEDFTKVIQKRNGKTAFEMNVTFSPDGNSLSADVVGTDENGNPYRDVEVFERRGPNRPPITSRIDQFPPEFNPNR